jgi:hypothetical protein
MLHEDREMAETGVDASMVMIPVNLAFVTNQV